MDSYYATSYMDSQVPYPNEIFHKNLSSVDKEVKFCSQLV